MKPPDMILGRFLTRLAVDKKLRASFEAAPKATLDGLNPPLRPAVKKAILERKRPRLFVLFNIANQSSGGDVPTGPTKKSAKKAAKKSSAKKSSPKNA